MHKALFFALLAACAVNVACLCSHPVAPGRTAACRQGDAGPQVSILSGHCSTVSPGAYVLMNAISASR
jgi:hypothetical protein